MDYEKLHNETLSNLQEMVSKGKITEEVAKGICADFVVESEDEKIRKELIEYHKTQAFLDGKPNNKHVKYVDWLERQGKHNYFINKIQVGDQVTRNEDGVLVNLSQLKRVAKSAEKQGEQKAIEHGSDNSLTEFEKSVRDIITAELCNNFGDVSFGVSISNEEAKLIAKKLFSVLQEQKPVEWSEEYEKTKDNLISELSNLATRRLIKNETYSKYSSWLKSLRPQKQWKPSEEQIKALDFAIDCTVYPEFQNKRKALKELLEQLKTL